MLLGERGSVESIARFRGVLIRPDRPGYDDARRLWNGAIDRRPALIARCVDADDAALALDHALRLGLPVAVRSGGHNVAGSALCDDGVVIDLAAMRGLMVDPERRRIHVQPGAVWGDFDAATQVHGLAAPAGVVEPDRRRRACRRWRLRLAQPPLGPDVRQRRGHGRAPGGWTPRAGRRRRAPGPLLGRSRGGGNFGIVTPGSRSSCTSSGPRCSRDRSSTRRTGRARSCTCTARPSPMRRGSSR